MEALTIGEVAKRAGVGVETLRYYERRGLLAQPPRSAANYRRYPAETVRRVQFIRRAQQLGFSLKEIGELLLLRVAPQAGCADVQVHAAMKLVHIEAKIRVLQAMQHALIQLMEACSGHGPVTDCPILAALEAEG